MPPVSEFFEYLNKSCLPRIRVEIPPEVHAHLDAALKFVGSHLGEHDAAYLHLKGLYEKERPVRNLLSHFLHPKAAGCAGGSASVSYRAATSTGCAGSSAAMSYSYRGPAVPAPALPPVKMPEPPKKGK